MVKILYLMSVIVGAILLSYLAYISWYLISARRGVYRMSITDQGTGLMNRVAYEKCLHKSDQRVIAPAACIYIDANGLHEINNERGHEAGDQLLRTVAERLREQFPRDDSLPRRRRRVRRVSRAGGRGGIRGADAGGF